MLDQRIRPDIVPPCTLPEFRQEIRVNVDVVSVSVAHVSTLAPRMIGVNAPDTHDHTSPAVTRVDGVSVSAAHRPNDGQMFRPGAEDGTAGGTRRIRESAVPSRYRRPINSATRSAWSPGTHRSPRNHPHAPAPTASRHRKVLPGPTGHPCSRRPSRPGSSPRR